MVKTYRAQSLPRNDVKLIGQQAHFMRYGCHEYLPAAKPLLPVPFIAKLLNVRPQQCYHALASHRRGLQSKTGLISQSTDPNAKSTVTVENITPVELGELITEEQLADHAHLSLQQRVATFNSRHQRRKLTVYHLRAIFQKHGIKKKFVKRRLTSARSVEYRLQEAAEFYAKFGESERKRHELIMIDECVFSAKGYQKTVWTQPKQNIILSKRFKNTDCIAAVAAISSRRGLLGYLLRKHSIKAIDFVDFIRMLKGKIGRRRKCSLLLDQCSVHRASISKDAMSGVDVIFNVAYSPWYNGIELYWAQAKQVFRRQLLRMMIDRQSLDLEALVRDALEAVTCERVKACADNALRLIRRDAEKAN